MIVQANAHIGIVCRNLAERAGDYIDLPPQMNCDHTWSMWFHDPDGNRIEVHQYTERSYQLIGRN